MQDGFKIMEGTKESQKMQQSPANTLGNRKTVRNFVSVFHNVCNLTHAQCT